MLPPHSKRIASSAVSLDHLASTHRKPSSAQLPLTRQLLRSKLALRLTASSFVTTRKLSRKRPIRRGRTKRDVTTKLRRLATRLSHSLVRALCASLALRRSRARLSRSFTMMQASCRSIEMNLSGSMKCDAKSKRLNSHTSHNLPIIRKIKGKRWLTRLADALAKARIVMLHPALTLKGIIRKRCIATSSR